MKAVTTTSHSNYGLLATATFLQCLDIHFWPR